jgi:hypothetical protein
MKTPAKSPDVRTFAPWPPEQELNKWTLAKLKEARAFADMLVELGNDPDPEYTAYLVSGKRGAPIKQQRGDPIFEAVWDVVTIKRIWLEHFGSKNRPKNYKAIAEDIAKTEWKIKRECDIKAFERVLRELKRARSGDLAGGY